MDVQERYKGYLLTIKHKLEGSKVMYKVIIHAKWLKIDETNWWTDEYTAVQDAKGRIEQRLRDKENKKK